MAKRQDWLHALANLRVDRSKGIAPHKPLLLLLAIEMVEQNELVDHILKLTPELAFRFSVYWSIVAHRRSHPPDVRLPFHHLHSDGFWSPFTKDGTRSPHRSVTNYVEIDADFMEFLRSPANRSDARRLLISLYFEPAEQKAFYSLFGIPTPTDEVREINNETRPQRDEEMIGREARFRLDIVSAYRYTCALTGYRITTIAGATIVDAAHIHQFADSRNNNPRNGLALSKNAHWMFDNGLWSIDDDYRIVVNATAFDEASPDQQPLAEYHGKTLRLPSDRNLWPDPKHLAWHRKHKLQMA
jgi:putative restriction endonuclease